MPQLLGDDLLPDSVVSRRSQFRERVQGLRQPVREFRESTLPGPDLIGQAEQRLMSLRNRAVSRDRLLDRIQMRRNDSGGGSSGNSGSESSSGNQPNTSQMT